MLFSQLLELCFSFSPAGGTSDLSTNIYRVINAFWIRVNFFPLLVHTVSTSFTARVFTVQIMHLADTSFQSNINVFEVHFSQYIF